MSDHSTPNLPSLDFDNTAQFYSSLGFTQIYRDSHWMIMKRGDLILEFFPHADLNPQTSWFSCCLRLDDLDGFYATCLAAGLPVANAGHPRLHAPKQEAWGGTMAAMIDLDGTLLRLIQN